MNHSRTGSSHEASDAVRIESCGDHVEPPVAPDVGGSALPGVLPRPAGPVWDAKEFSVHGAMARVVECPHFLVLGGEMIGQDPAGERGDER